LSKSGTHPLREAGTETLDRTTPQNSSRQLSHLTMQSPTTAQLGAAIVGLEPFGEHINHAAANTVIGWPEAQHYDANIEARTIEQTDRIQTIARNGTVA
jgi:hypothetical protein